MGVQTKREFQESREKGQIITTDMRWSLAKLAGDLQGVKATEARLPSSASKSISELKQVSKAAASVRSGLERGKKDLASILAGSKPAPVVKFGKTEIKEISRLAEACAEEDPSCLRHRQAVQSVLQAGLELDFLEGNKEALWTRRALTFVSERLNQLSELESLLREAKPPVGPDSIIPVTPEGKPLWPRGTEVQFIGPGWEHMPGPPENPVQFPDWNLGQLCANWFSELAAGILDDPWVDVIGEVTPDRVRANGYDENTAFVARPAVGRSFDSFAAAFANPDVEDVRLYFRDLDITDRIVDIDIDKVPQEIRFTIPEGQYSGAVHIRRPIDQFESYEPGISGACGGEPHLPAEWLTREGPGAVIWIVHVPSIRLVYPSSWEEYYVHHRNYANNPPPWVPLEIAWQAGIQGQLPDAPLPPDINFVVTIHDEDGNLVAEGHERAGTFTRSDEEDICLVPTVEAFLGDESCGSFTGAPRVIRRNRQVEVSRVSPDEDLVYKGEILEIEASIPPQSASPDARELEVKVFGAYYQWWRDAAGNHHSEWIAGGLPRGWEVLGETPMLRPNETSTNVRIRFDERLNIYPGSTDRGEIQPVFVEARIREPENRQDAGYWRSGRIAPQLVGGLGLIGWEVGESITDAEGNESVGRHAIAHHPLLAYVQLRGLREPPTDTVWRLVRTDGSSNTTFPLEATPTGQQEIDGRCAEAAYSYTRQSYQIKLAPEHLESFEPGKWVIKVEAPELGRTDRGREFTVRGRVDLKLEQVEVLAGQTSLLDYDTSLDVAVVTFTEHGSTYSPERSTYIWPDQPADVASAGLRANVTIGVDSNVFPRDLIETIAVHPDAGESTHFTVQGLVWDDDPSEDDWGISEIAEIPAECGEEHVRRLVVPIVKNIAPPDINYAYGGFIESLDPGSVEGVVRLTYKTVPRTSPTD